MSPRTGPRRRLGSIRLSLILLALVPSVTLAAIWSVTTIQMFSEGLGLRSQAGLSKSTGAMGTEATLALQRERSFSAVWLATRQDAARTGLDEQRGRTDKAVAKLLAQSDEIQRAPARVKDRLYSVVASVSSLEYYRGQVDNPSDISAVQALGQYTSIIDDQIHAFQELSQVDDGDLTSQAGPLVSLEHAAELMSREDALLTLASPTRRMDEKEWTEFAELVNTRRWLVDDQILPSLTGAAKAETERILAGEQWRTLERVEDRVLAARATAGKDGTIAVPDSQKEWRAALTGVTEEYSVLIQQQTTGLLQRSGDEARGLLIKAASLSAGGLIALLLCVGMSWRITRSLFRRLRGLREATLGLAQERLPDVVARLERGEKVDVELATPPLDYGRDELGQVAQAFNTAQRTAVHTAVELADTRRGFQKIILGIARQSQNLVNLQLTKLDALERTHQDPEVLKGLYELDSTASQLRRYEENLVIISGERPGRSWTEPVALIDILRSAVGEVAEYRRVEVHTDEEVHLAPPAVADVIHLLAELIENATLYSPAPAPVGVRAAMVAKGLAVEVEDRGLGMSEEEYAAFNAQLAEPPQFDVVALADDLRLGMFVIAQLARRHGITVTLRSSPYGGTTAIVLIPHEVVVRDLPAADLDEVEHAGAAEPEEPVRDARPVAQARPATAPAPEPGARRDGLSPLPRRVPQTSLAAELREESAPAEPDGHDEDFTAEQAASSLAGFQRGTLRARDDAGDDETPDPLDPADHEGPAALARFQRGSLEARDDDRTPDAPGAADLRVPAARRTRDDVASDEPASAESAAAPTSSTPPADRS